jgi:hypothetical protein
MAIHEHATPTPAHERAHTRLALAALLFGVASLILALVALVFLLWLMLSSVQATSFDADGVRCYKTAIEMTCLKTANP